MASLKPILLTTLLAATQITWAQSPAFGVGRKPTAEEIKSWDISIGPEGKELPPGKGTAKEGSRLYLLDRKSTRLNSSH